MLGPGIIEAIKTVVKYKSHVSKVIIYLALQRLPETSYKATIKGETDKPLL